MKKKYNCKTFKFIFFFILFSQFLFGQLSDFTLNVSKTDETCTGNGSLSFSVQNQTPNSTVLYSIYLLPNVTTPIASTQNNTFTGLQSGNYTVIATQSLGDLSNTSQQTVQIDDLRVLLTYQLANEQNSCSTGAIEATVLTGNPVSYEIISGPIIIPPQTLNIFSGLVSGTYNIRVNDACGDGVVQTYTLNFSNLPNLTLGNFNTNCELSSCNSISGTFLVNAAQNTSIHYPLTIQTTISPPSGGNPIIQSQVLTSGSSDSQSVSLIVPFFYGQTYTLNIQVTDQCGNSYNYNSITILEQITANAQQINANCTSGIQISICNFLPPYTVSFISAPTGFNPSSFNDNHPGPFNSNVLVYNSTNSNNLPYGDYTIQITDSCGRIAQTQVSISTFLPGYEVIAITNSCIDESIVNIPVGDLLVTTVIITNGSTVLNQTFPYDVSFNINSGNFSMQLPPGVYNFTGIDQCGNSFQYEITIPPKIVQITATGSVSNGCATNNGNIAVSSIGVTISSITIISAPLAFMQTLPYLVPLLGSNNFNIQIPNLPIGNYTLVVTDNCNQEYVLTATISNVVNSSPLGYFTFRGCGEGLASIEVISPNGSLQEVTIISAPSSFPFSLPYDVSFNIASNGIFYMNSLPEGTYTFYSKDICNVERTETKLLFGYHVFSENIEVYPNCGSFDLMLNYNDNSTYGTTFWLQKYNSITGQWVHPITGVVYPSGTLPSVSNSINLVNYTTNFNISSLGQFRILKTYLYFSSGSSNILNCNEIIKIFEYNDGLQIINAYSFPCADQSAQVVIEATGIPPLIYRITLKDNVPFIVNNGNSNIFSGLQPGIYNFQVQDDCGNIVNRLFDVTSLPEPTIIPENLCEGLNGQLSVPNIAFLNYQWWKDSDPTNILSTSNILTFSPFTNSTPGTYYVRIYSTSSLSCADLTISYSVLAVNIPSAGESQTVTICDSSSSINLFTILLGPYDNNGVWEEISDSNALNGNIWSPFNLPLGTYIFKYIVNGSCGNFDEAFITVNLDNGPPIPILNSNANVCEGDDIIISVDNILNNNITYSWIGPNNFSSTNPNILISNSNPINYGTYSVTAFLNGCQQTSSIDINILSIPKFKIDYKCVNNEFMLEVIPINNSLVSDISSFNWYGPNGFSSTNSSVIVTNFSTGTYGVNLINNQNCRSTLEIELSSTLCSIPNVITPNSDGSNDSFDLTGLLVDNIEIYNRWGRLVYDKSNYINEWIGQNNEGKLLPDSTYFYLLKLKSGEVKSGWVLIVTK